MSEPDLENEGLTMNERRQPSPPCGDVTRRPAVGGTLLDALDAALVAAWDDDALMEALAHDEGLVEVVADLELAIETLRSALARLSPADRAASDRDKGLGETNGLRPNRTEWEDRPNG